MAERSAQFALKLLGPFRLSGPDGARIEISSRKGMALIALLALARDGERTRPWLQARLWGSRSPVQASASLRRELSNLRQALNAGPRPLLIFEHARVRLDLDQIVVDAHGADTPRDLELLEGLDLSEEEEFEDWLRGQRNAFEDDGRRSSHLAPPSVPTTILDRSRPGEGFFGRPFLAVLRFGNLTGDPEADYLAEGLAEDLLEQLSRLRWIPIVASGASFAHSTETGGLREIGIGLGARYLVEGRLRRVAKGFELATSMSDAETGRAILTQKTSFDAGAVNDLQPLLTEIVSALSSRIDDAEMTRAIAKPQDDPQVGDLVWRARWHHNQYTPEDNRIAQALLEEALVRQPHSPEAIVQLAYFRQRQMWLNRASIADIMDLRRLAQRAISADYLDARGYMIAGIAELWLRHTNAAITLLQQAITLNPSLAYAYAQLGSAYYLSGEPALAIGMLTEALRLNIGETYAYFVLGEIAMARSMLEQWDAAVEAADQAIVRRPAYWYAHVGKVHALMSRGDHRQAHEALQALRAAKPSFKASFLEWVPFVDPAWPNRLKTSLRDAAEPPIEDARAARHHG